MRWKNFFPRICKDNLLVVTIRLGTNIASLGAQRRLGDATQALSRTFERLSSGMRINRASDDAAGMAIASSLNVNRRVFGQGIRNINDGVSMLNIAEGGLQQLGTISMRIRELATQSANGTYSLTQRRSLDSEADALVAEFNRITSSVTFNGQKLLSGELRNLSLQMGGNSLSTSLGGNLGTQVGNGTIASSTTLSFSSGNTNEVSMVDLNGDGKLDMVHGGSTTATTGLYVRMGNGDGTFGNSTGYQGYFAERYVVADVNGDGKLDALGYGNTGGNISVIYGNGDGSFGAMTVLNPLVGAVAKSVTGISVGDFNGDGRVDIAAIMADSSDHGTNSFGIYYGNGNGTFAAGASLSVGGVTSNSTFTVGDYNNDGIDDIVVNNAVGGFISTLIGKNSGISRQSEFRYSTDASTGVAAGDFNGDGILDIAVNYQSTNTLSIGLGNGDGTFQAAISIIGSDTDYTSLTVGDLNGDGILDIVSSDYNNNRISIFVGNGNGQFSISSTYALGASAFNRAATIADIDGDGSMELVIGRNGGTAFILNQNDSYSTQMATLNLNSQANARGVLSYLDEIDQRVREELSSIGSLMSRLDYAANNLRTSREQFAAAQSRIEDVDIAEESSNQIRTSILQQAAASILGQANLQPQLALTLLR